MAAYFFPVLFAIPLFGTYLAREWAWSFTPSLAYMGQGIKKYYYAERRCSSISAGIIMGLPTALSMNLVRRIPVGEVAPLI